MSNYIPNKQKKNKIFHKREVELRHAIKHGFSSEKIDSAAERLRTAKFAAFKARFDEKSLNPPFKFNLEDGAKLDKGVAKWVSMTTAEIVDEYSKGDK